MFRNCVQVSSPGMYPVSGLPFDVAAAPGDRESDIFDLQACENALSKAKETPQGGG